jgi:heat shock protein HslJ
MTRINSGTTIVICGLLIACSAIHPQKAGREPDGMLITPQQLKNIVGQEWHLLEMTRDNDPVALVENSKMTFSCSGEGQVTGVATINRYFGNLKLTEDGEIVWNKAFGMTRMAGPPELMQQEAAYMGALIKTSRMYLKEAKLVLRNKDRSYLLEFGKIKK